MRNWLSSWFSSCLGVVSILNNYATGAPHMRDDLERIMLLLEQEEVWRSGLTMSMASVVVVGHFHR